MLFAMIVGDITASQIILCLGCQHFLDRPVVANIVSVRNRRIISPVGTAWDDCLKIVRC